MKRSLIVLMLAGAVAAAACTPLEEGGSGFPEDRSGRRAVILDYSPTLSDIGALAFVATHPDVDLLAVTLPGRGESFCPQGVAHTRGVLIELGLGDVPVACSESDLPYAGINDWPVFWRQGANALDLPEGEPNESRFAADLIIDTVRGARTPVEILAVGPLTNLAVAFDRDPDLAARLDGVTIMGGAVDVPGNVFANEVAEWNIWVDPVAAARVFESGADLTLVPLDATNDLPANRVFFDALDAAAIHPPATLLRDLIASDDFWLAGEFFFWDELAAAVLVDESIVEFQTRNVLVNTGPEYFEGWTREDAAGMPVRVAVSADRVAFEQLYLDTLIGGPTDLGYREPTTSDLEYFERAEAVTSAASAEFDAVFEETAARLGFSGDDLDEESFGLVIEAALGTIFGGPWQDQIAALEELQPPERLAELHEAWVEQLRAFATHEAEIAAAVGAGGFEAIEPFFTPLAEACADVQAAADRYLMVVDFGCF